MKSSFLLYYLLFVSLNISGQNNYLFLKDIALGLPDSIMEVGDFQTMEIQIAWNGFDSLQREDDSCVEGFFLASEAIELESKEFVKIDTTNLFFCLTGISGNQLQIKSIISEGDTSVIININSSSEGEPSRCLFIGFYLVQDNYLVDFTESILTQLNYLSDNFSKPTIDSLFKYYTNPNNPISYLYGLSTSDTITISFSLYQFYCCDPGYFYIDPNYLEVDFFQRKYLFSRDGLIPIGKIRKKRISKTPIFMLQSE